MFISTPANQSSNEIAGITGFEVTCWQMKDNEMLDIRIGVSTCVIKKT